MKSISNLALVAESNATDRNATLATSRPIVADLIKKPLLSIRLLTHNWIKLVIGMVIVVVPLFIRGITCGSTAIVPRLSVSGDSNGESKLII